LLYSPPQNLQPVAGGGHSVRRCAEPVNMNNFSGAEALGYLKSLSTKVKQMALNLTDLEVKVEEATNNDPWGPHGTVMAGRNPP
jgi:ENTH domain